MGAPCGWVASKLGKPRREAAPQHGIRRFEISVIERATVRSLENRSWWVHGWSPLLCLGNWASRCASRIGKPNREVARREGNFVVGEVADRLDVRATGVWVECTRLTHGPGNREMRVDTINSAIVASDCWERKATNSTLRATVATREWTRRSGFVGHHEAVVVAKMSSSPGQPEGESVAILTHCVAQPGDESVVG